MAMFNIGIFPHQTTGFSRAWFSSSHCHDRSIICRVCQRFRCAVHELDEADPVAPLANFYKNQTAFGRPRFDHICPIKVFVSPPSEKKLPPNENLKSSGTFLLWRVDKRKFWSDKCGQMVDNRMQVGFNKSSHLRVPTSRSSVLDNF